MTTKEEWKEARLRVRSYGAWVSAARANPYCTASDVDVAQGYLNRARSEEKELRRRVRKERWDSLSLIMASALTVAGLAITIARCIDG